jgi:hypothetical protein
MKTHLAAYDPDNTGDQQQFRVAAKPSHGVLKLSGQTLGVGSRFTQDDLDNDRLVYHHDGSETTTDSFGFKLSDAGGGNEPAGTFDITILPANDAPELTLPNGVTAVEDGPAAINGIVIADDDVGGADLRLSLSVSAGTLSIGTLGTATIENGNDGEAGFDLVGTLAELNAAVATLSYTTDANSTTSDTLALTLSDQGGSGADPDAGGVPGDGDGNLTFESVTDSVPITVRSVNDAPVLTVPGSQTVNEDTDLDINGISIADIDAASGELDLTLSVGEGTLKLLGTTGLAFVSGSNGDATITVRGTLTELNTSLAAGLRYRGDQDFFGSDSLSLTISDRGNTGDIGGVKNDTATIALTIDPINDNPSADAVSTSGTEDAAQILLTLSGDDVDRDTNTTTDAIVSGFRIADLPTGGTLQDSNGVVLNVDAVIGIAEATNMRFVPASNFNGDVSFNYLAVDEAGAESPQATASSQRQRGE